MSPNDARSTTRRPTLSRPAAAPDQPPAAANTGPTAGAVAVLAGVLLLLAVPLVQLVAGDFFLLVPLGVLLLALALPGLHAAQGPTAPSRGRAGARLASVGGLVLVPASVAGEADVPGALVVLAVAGCCLLAGFVLFGLAALRGGRYPRWAAAVLAVVFPLAAVAESFAHVEVLDQLGIAGIVVTALAAVRLGAAAGRPSR